MEIEKRLLDNETLLVKVANRIDINTAVEFGNIVNDAIDDNKVKELIIDFTDVNYISSIGLRVMLEIQKKMNQLGSMVVKNVNAEVMEIFKMTGFNNVITIV